MEERWRSLLEKDFLTRAQRKEICNAVMTTEPQMERLIMKYFSMEDFQEIVTRKIGGGMIGGKSCGLLTAQKLMQIRLPECEDNLEKQSSWYIGTDVFSRYLEKGIEYAFEGIEDQLHAMLEEFGDLPYVVRSSSILEDGYDSAFSGKYESVFCVGGGDEAARFDSLKNAMQRVFDSVKNAAAVEYRRRRRLLEKDEKMALLVQKVAGQQFGDLYFPVAAGMGCSYNPYKWMEHISPEAGMIRMVMGLGTRAVQRTPGDYPRLVGLDRARANLRSTVAEQHEYSQRKVDLIDRRNGCICTRVLEEVIGELPEYIRRRVLSRDSEAEELLAQRRVYRKIFFADCQGMVENREFIDLMRRSLKMLEQEYKRPVDIEFAVTEEEPGEWRLHLLQCRPLQNAPNEEIQIPKDADERMLFDVRRTSMRRSKREPVDYIVWIDPQNYYECPYARKSEAARVIGRINDHFKGTDAHLMLLSPGRIGTSSPELGVPVSYEEISCFDAVCEVAYGKAGYHPNLSYGSHMFQDMIEADVYYGALSENSKTRLYQPELLNAKKEILGEILPKEAAWTDIVKLYDVRGCGAALILDFAAGRAVCILESGQEKNV